MKINCVFLSVLFSLLVCVPAFCLPVTFSGTCNNSGTSTDNAPVSAWLDYSIAGHTLSIDLRNTSDVSYYNSEGTATGSNSPAITHLAFDVANDVTGSSLQIQAYEFLIDEGNPANELSDISAFWRLDSGTLQGSGSLEFEFIPSTGKGQGAKYGLINPSAEAESGNNLYATPSFINIVFSGDPGAIDNWYIRFQNVGPNGEWSMDAQGVPDNPVPEPGTMLLLGSGLMGLVSLKKRLLKQD